MESDLENTEGSLLEAIIRQIDVSHAKDGEWSEKYGTEIDNEVLMMHPYCWCEEDTCKWCTGEAPNFRYKPSDLRVTWYKYIGRGMDANRTTNGKELSEILSACLGPNE